MKWHLTWHLIWHSTEHLFCCCWVFNDINSIMPLTGYLSWHLTGQFMWHLVIWMSSDMTFNWTSVFLCSTGFWSFCHTYSRTSYQMPCQVSYKMTPDMASDMTFNRTFFFISRGVQYHFCTFCHTYSRSHIFKCQVFTCWHTSWCLFAQTYLLIWVLLFVCTV